MSEYDNIPGLGKTERGDPASLLPPEAMFIKKHNSGASVALENLVDGYQTASVTGRELASLNLTSKTISGKPGALAISSQLNTREITVTYRLEAPDNQSFRERFQRLNDFLNDPYGLYFYFNDDPRYLWWGFMTKVETPPAGSNSIISSFTMTCPDPYKYSTQTHLIKGQISTTQSVVVNEPLFNPAQISSIDITPSQSVNDLKLTFTNVADSSYMDHRYMMPYAHDTRTRVLHLNSDGQNMSGTISVSPHDGYVRIGNTNHVNWLAVDSDFENLRLFANMKITASVPCSIAIKYWRAEL